MTARISCILFCAFFLLAPLAPARAEDTEHREYSVFVDGKDAGISRMTLVQKDDGTTYMSGTVNVKFRHLLIAEYAIKIETQEVWKNGRLISMNTKSSENGKKSDVSVTAEGNQTRLRVNGLDRMIKPETWTTSYWKLADARFHNKQIPILDCDSGKEYNCELRYIETQQLKVGKEVQNCYHFRVSSAPGPVDLWFDQYHRLVKQEFADSGHKIIVQLLTIRR
jgi:Family of unknown function (DUF6134)